MRNVWLIAFLICCLAAEAQDFRDSTVVFPFKAGTKWTFRNQAGFIAGTPYFDTIFLSDQLTYLGYVQAIVSNKKKFGVVRYREKLDTIIPISCDSVIELNPMCYFLKQQGNWKTVSFTCNNKTGKESWVYEALGKLDSVYVDKKEEIAYWWRNGNMGVKLLGRKPLLTNYPFIRLFNTMSYNSGYQHRLSPGWRSVGLQEPVFLVSNGKSFGLVRPDKELVPCVSPSIQPFNELFCRYWNQSYWIYVRYKDGFQIDPKGGTVVFYSDSSWKLYTPNHVFAGFFLNGKRFPVSGYDDCFMVSESYLAVRKGREIGLLSAKGTVLISPRFEQIDALGSKLFRVLNQGKWYLANESGIILSKKGYDYIGSFRSDFEGKPVFEVHLAGKRGVMDLRGNELIPVAFSGIALLDRFILGTENGQCTVFGVGGKKIGQNTYEGYRENQGLLILYYNESRKDVFTRNQQLNQFPFTHISNLGEVVKLYGKDQLEVLVLNADGTRLEERQVYDGTISFKVTGFKDQEGFFWFSEQCARSYLEEHQQSGYFGYRKTFDTTHVLKPDFLECYEFGSFEWELGVRNFREEKWTTQDGLKLLSLFDFDVMDPENAELEDEQVTYVSLDHRTGWSGYYSLSSGDVFSFSGTAGKKWFHSGQLHAASDVTAIDYSGMNSLAYYLGGNYVPADWSDDQAVSNYERLVSMNTYSNLSPVDEGIAEIMQLRASRKLAGGRWFVKELPSLEKVNSGLQGKYYADFRYVRNPGADNETFLAKLAIGENWNWNYQKGDSVPNRAYSGIRSLDENGLMLVERSVRQADGSYVSLQGLCTPDREVLLEPEYDAITILSWDLILVNKGGRYGVIDFGKNWIVPL